MVLCIGLGGFGMCGSLGGGGGCGRGLGRCGFIWGGWGWWGGRGWGGWVGWIVGWSGCGCLFVMLGLVRWLLVMVWVGM